MNFDVHNIPFSMYGSYFALSHVKWQNKGDTLFLRSVHSQERARPLFAVVV